MNSRLVKLSVLSALVLLVIPTAFATTYNAIAITTNGTAFTAGQTLVVTGTTLDKPYPSTVVVDVFYFNPNAGFYIFGHYTGEWVPTQFIVGVNSNGQFTTSYVLPNNGFTQWYTSAWYSTSHNFYESNAVSFSVVD